MTQEIKQKLKQAAETAWEEDQQTNPTPVNPHAYVYGYKAGAKAILDNPSEFGLMCKIEASEHIQDTDSAWEDALVELKDQNKRYREALERISNTHDEAIEIDPKGIAYKMQKEAQGALKQEDTK